MPSRGDAVVAELAKQRQQNVLDEIVLGARAKVRSKLVATLSLGGRKRAMRVRLWRRHGLGTDVPEVAVFVVPVERLEPLAVERCVQLSQRIWAVGGFVEGLGGSHQVIDHPAEAGRRMSGAIVRLGQ